MRRLLRRVRNYLLVLLALVVVATGYLTLTPPGRANLASIISSVASSEDAGVTISGIGGIWGGPLTVEHVVLSDRNGPWLALRDISTDVSLVSAAFGTIKAEELTVGRIELARTPVSEPSSEPSKSFELPVDIDIARINLPDVTIGPELVASGAQIAANGRALVTGSPFAVDTEIDARRLDALGELALTAVYAPAQDRLELTVEGQEPAGGVVANMLRLPGAPPVSIAVEGKGPASNWQAQGAIAVDEQVAVTLSGTHQFVAEGSRISLTGKGQFAQFLPETVRKLAHGETDISVAGIIGSDGLIKVDDATLTSSALTASARGTIDPKAQSDFALEARAAGEPVEFAFGEGEDRVALSFSSAEATVRGNGERPALSAAVTLASLNHPQVSARNIGLDVSSPGFDVRDMTGALDIAASVASITSNNATLAPLLAGQTSLTAKADVETGAVRISDAKLGNDALSATAAGTLSRTDGAASFDIAANVARSALPQGAHGVLGETVAFKGAVTRAADGAISVTGLDLASGPLAVAGSTSIKDGVLDTDLTGRLADLSNLAKDVSGAIDFSVVADGPLLTPDIKLEVTGDRIETGGRAITGLKLAASGRADPADLAADLTLTGKVGDETLNGVARLATANGRRQVSRLNLSLGQNKISGDLDLDDAFLPVGQVAFDLPQIAPLAALALQQVSGSARGTVSFANGASGPSVRVDASIPEFSREDVTGRDVRIEADVQNYVASPSISGRITATGISASGAKISGLDVTLSRDGDWTAFDGDMTVNDIPAKAVGRALYADGAATVELSSGSATVQGVAAAIAGKSVIRNANGVTTIDTLALNLGGGTARVSGTVGSQLAITADLAQVPASLANNFAAGLGAAGTVNGTVRVTGATSAPNVEYDVTVTGGQVSQTVAAGFGQMNVQSRGTFAGGTLNFNATVGEGSGLALSGGGSVQTTGAKALNVNMSGQVPFGFLTRRLAQQGLALTGTASAQISVTGTTAAPVIGGRVQSSGARFIDAGSGIAVNDLATVIDLGGGVARITSLTGKLSSGGDLNASGTIGIDADAGFPADLSIKLGGGRYTDGRVVTANFGGDLTVKGPLATAPAIAGTVTLDRTVITLPEKMSPSLARLNVQHRNASNAVARQAEALKPATAASGAGGGGLTLDLTVSAPQEIFVRGRGLNAELGGQIRLTGPASAPMATGLFEMRRGRLGILGRRLDFDEGSIGFSGSLVPELNFAATSTISSGTISVTVTGEANNPKFGFSSVPALPEDEVFAQLVFGRAMGNLSAVQIAQLAQAAAVLAGVGGTTGLLDNLQSQLGVDDIDVKTDEATGDTAVSVGKYLNDRTYITIEKGSRPGSGKAAIDLQVGKGVKLRGEASDDGSTKGGIFYEKEY
ncbi:MAG: translocation/assembly module TamB domain-containing protein [Mesorhizobium sp.]